MQRPCDRVDRRQQRVAMLAHQHLEEVTRGGLGGGGCGGMCVSRRRRWMGLVASVGRALGGIGDSQVARIREGFRQLIPP
jgi:hypothetical protein